MMLCPDAARRRSTLAGSYGLTIAEILYRLPDHPRLLQTYIWQDYDVTPTFPALNKFLAFWRTTLEGALYAVRVDHATLVRRSELRMIGAEYRLH